MTRTRADNTTLHPIAYRQLSCSRCGAVIRTSVTDGPTLKHYDRDETGWPSHRCAVARDIVPFDTDDGPAKRETAVYLPTWDEYEQRFIGSTALTTR